MGADQDVNEAAVADALGSVISRISGVRAARVVTQQGRVAEVHVVASTERAPKQLVRDIQSAAKASFDLDLDYRTISIVQLDETAAEDPAGADAPVETRPAPRLPLVRVIDSTAGQLATVDVVLRHEDLELIGQVKGAVSRADELVARATLQAIEPLLQGRVGEVVGVGIHDVAGTSVAVVAIRLIAPTVTRLVSGSAVVGADQKDAIARATLDAVNRVAS